MKKSVSGFLGVTKIADSQRFQARIDLNNRMIHLGVTKDPVEAAQLYNTAAQFLYGAFAGELRSARRPSGTWIQWPFERRGR